MSSLTPYKFANPISDLTSHVSNNRIRGIPTKFSQIFLQNNTSFICTVEDEKLMIVTRSLLKKAFDCRSSYNERANKYEQLDEDADKTTLLSFPARILKNLVFIDYDVQDMFQAKLLVPLTNGLVYMICLTQTGVLLYNNLQVYHRITMLTNHTNTKVEGVVSVCDMNLIANKDNTDYESLRLAVGLLEGGTEVYQIDLEYDVSKTHLQASPIFQKRNTWNPLNLFRSSSGLEESYNSRRVYTIEYIGGSIVSFVDDHYCQHVKNLESGHYLMTHQLENLRNNHYYKLQSNPFSPFSDNNTTDIYVNLTIGAYCGKGEYLQIDGEYYSEIKLLELNFNNPHNEYIKNFSDVSQQYKDKFQDSSCFKNFSVKSIPFENCNLLEYQLTETKLYVSLFDSILIKNKLEIYNLTDNLDDDKCLGLLDREIVQTVDDGLIQDLQIDYNTFKKKPTNLTHSYMTDRIMKQGRFNFHTMKKVFLEEIKVLEVTGKQSRYNINKTFCETFFNDNSQIYLQKNMLENLIKEIKDPEGIDDSRVIFEFIRKLTNAHLNKSCVTCIGVSSKISYFPIILRENNMLSYLSKVTENEEYWIKLEKSMMTTTICNSYDTYLYQREVNDNEYYGETFNFQQNADYEDLQKYIKFAEEKYYETNNESNPVFHEDSFLCEGTKDDIDRVLLNAINLMRSEDPGFGTNNSQNYWVAKEWQKTECQFRKEENANININWKAFFNWVQERCTFDKTSERTLMLCDVLVDNKAGLLEKIRDILDKFEAKLQMDFDENFEVRNQALNVSRADTECNVKMANITHSKFFIFTNGVVNCTSQRLVNYLQRNAGFLVDLLFLYKVIEKISGNRFGVGSELENNEELDLYEGMKINCQIYLGLESVCQHYVKNQTKIFNYTRSKNFTKYISSLREVSVSTDIISTFYNNFDSDVMEHCKNSYSNDLVNRIVENVFCIIKGHIPDQNPAFLQHISLYLQNNDEYENFRRFEILINDNNPYFDFGRAVMAFEQEKGFEFVRYIYHIASFIHMGKLVGFSIDDENDNNWFLKGPWCKMNDYFNNISETNTNKATLSEFFRIVFEQFSKKKPKIVSTLALSVINMKYIDSTLRIDYAKQLINSIMDHGDFKNAINLIHGLNISDKTELHNMLIKKMLDKKDYDELRSFCVSHPCGNELRKYIFDESIKMIPELSGMIQRKPVPYSTINSRLQEIYSRFAVLYQIFSMEQNPKEAGLQMLFLFKELSHLYSDHEDILSMENKQSLLEYKLDAANLALFCQEELDNDAGYPAPLSDSINYPGHLPFNSQSSNNSFGIYSSLVETQNGGAGLFIKMEHLSSIITMIKSLQMYNKIYQKLKEQNSEKDKLTILKTYVCCEDYYNAVLFSKEVQKNTNSECALVDLMSIKWCDTYINFRDELPVDEDYLELKHKLENIEQILVLICSDEVDRDDMLKTALAKRLVYQRERYWSAKGLEIPDSLKKIFMNSIAQKYIQFMLDYRFYKDAADNCKNFIIFVFEQLNQKMCGEVNSVDKIYIEKELVARVILSVENCVQTVSNNRSCDYEANSSKLENGGFTEDSVKLYQNYRRDITQLLMKLAVN